MTIIVPPTPASRDIASVTTDLEKRLKTVEAGLRTVQLNNSSLNGSVDIYDDSGTYRGTWGIQPDGVVAFISTNNPAPPPIPAAPIATPGIATVIVSHNMETDTGIAWPGDTTHLNIYYKEAITTQDPIKAGTITPVINGAGGSLVIGPLTGGEYEFTCTAVNLSGKESPPSIAVVATPDQVVNEQTLQEIITDLQANEGIVTEAMLAAQAVTETKIANDSIHTPHIVAGAIQSAQIATDAINAGHIISGEVTTRHLRALSITGDKIDVNQINAGHIRSGAVTALKLEANLVLASRIICGVPTGNRVELHPTLGIVAYTNDGAKRSLWIDASTGNLTAVGQWSTGFDGERIIVETNGSLTFIDSANFVSGKIVNDGTNGIFFRARWDNNFTSDTSFLFLSRTNCYIGYGKPGRFVASFAIDNAGVQQWGRLCGIRYMQGYSGDGTTPRLFILGTETDGSDTGLSTLHFMKRGSPGNREPIIIATGQDCGILFESQKVKIIRGNPFTFAAIDALAFNAQSSETTKDNLGPVTLREDRTELDMIEGAPVFDFTYKDDTPPPDVAQDIDGTPVLARVRNESINAQVWESLPMDHPDKWKYEETPLAHIQEKYRRRTHRFPLAEDLMAIDPEIVEDGTVDLRDMIGILWGAMDKLIKRQRVLEDLLTQRIPNLKLPPRPQKGDMIEGIGRMVEGRTRRIIDPTTGQARRIRG